MRILPTLYDGRTRYARETLGRDPRAVQGPLLRHRDPPEREAARGGQPRHADLRSARTRERRASTTRRSRSRWRPRAPERAAAPRRSRRRERVARGGGALPRRRRERRAHRGRLQRLGARQGRALADRVRGRDARVDQDPPAPARDAISIATSSTASGATIRRTRSASRARSAAATRFSSCASRPAARRDAPCLATWLTSPITSFPGARPAVRRPGRERRAGSAAAARRSAAGGRRRFRSWRCRWASATWCARRSSGTSPSRSRGWARARRCSPLPRPSRRRSGPRRAADPSARRWC